MSRNSTNAAPKVHPAAREMLPDDPLEMQAFQLPGDPHLMLRMLVEEYARLGWGAETILQLARDSNYQAFQWLRETYGDDDQRRLVTEILARCGVMRVKVVERTPVSEQLIQIELPE